MSCKGLSEKIATARTAVLLYMVVSPWAPFGDPVPREQLDLTGFLHVSEHNETLSLFWFPLQWNYHINLPAVI